MKTKLSLFSILFILCFVVLSLSEKVRASDLKDKKSPNIVFILADDMGFGDLGCYNSASKIPTPNIDKLADKGIQFTNAHSPGAWCVPSRYGLLTGQYPGRLAEMNIRKQSLIKPEQETLATMLKRNGYKTSCVGKWHLGFEGVDWSNPAGITEMKDGPTEKGFDYFFGMHASLDIPPYFYIENGKAVQSPTKEIGDGAVQTLLQKYRGHFIVPAQFHPILNTMRFWINSQKKLLAF